MYSEWVADHMVSVFWITDDLRSDLCWVGDGEREEKKMGELWQHFSSNIHANKTNWAKLSREQGKGWETESGVREQRQRRERETSERSQHRRKEEGSWWERTEREWGFLLRWSLYREETRSLTKIKLTYRQPDMLSDQNKTQCLLEEKL